VHASREEGKEGKDIQKGNGGSGSIQATALRREEREFPCSGCKKGGKASLDIEGEG